MPRQICTWCCCDFCVLMLGVTSGFIFYAYILHGFSLITGATRLPWDSWIILKDMGKFYGYETALTQNCLLTPYSDIALGQYWFRWWLDAISRWCGYMASTWEQLCIMSFKMIILITATSPRASELKQLRANRVRKRICLSIVKLLNWYNTI